MEGTQQQQQQQQSPHHHHHHHTEPGWSEGSGSDSSEDEAERKKKSGIIGKAFQKLDNIANTVDRVSESMLNQMGHRPADNQYTTRTSGPDPTVAEAHPPEMYGVKRADIQPGPSVAEASHDDSLNQFKRPADGGQQTTEFRL